MDLRLSCAVGDGAIQECRDVAVRWETENPGRMSARLPDGVFFRLGQYGWLLLPFTANADNRRQPGQSVGTTLWLG